MPTWIQPLADLIKWVTNLPKNKLVIFLYSLVVVLLGVENYNLRQDNDRYRDRADYYSNRMDSLGEVYEKRINALEEIRAKEISANSEFWRGKFEKMEERLYKDYDEIKKLKGKR